MKTNFDRSVTCEEWDALRYPVKLYPLTEEEGGGYLATIPLLGEATCAADGDTLEEALDSLEAYRRSLYDYLIETGNAVPLPPARPDESAARPSGKWVQRVSPDLHGELQNAAKAAGVSFNTYCLGCLERGHQANAAESALRAEFATLKSDLAAQLGEELRRELRDEMRLQMHTSLTHATYERTRAKFENATIHVEPATVRPAKGKKSARQNVEKATNPLKLVPSAEPLAA